MTPLILLAAALAGPAPQKLAVLVRPVEKGQLLSPGDFELVAPGPGGARSALSVEEASGMEAARRLRQGMAVQSTDLVSPRMVRRGEVVTISFASGPLLITTTGRALSDAGKGEALRVVSLSTNRTLDVVAEKAGHVVIPH